MKKVYALGGISVNRYQPTKKQRVLLDLLKSGYSVKQIAEKKKCSRKAVYKMLYRLEAKGLVYLSGKKQGGPQAVTHFCRNHANQYRIYLIYGSGTYYNLQKKHKVLRYGDFTVNLYKDGFLLSINRDFIDRVSYLAYLERDKYLSSVLTFLERVFVLKLPKSEGKYCKKVRSENSYTDSEIARKAYMAKQIISIRDKASGKVWLKTDNSLNLKELETCDPEKADQDYQEIIEPFFNTLRREPNLLENLKKGQLSANEEIIDMLKTLLNRIPPK